MNVEITIKDKVVEIALRDGKNIVDSVSVIEEHRLSEDLLPKIDDLLKRNELSFKDVEKMALQSDMSENFTTQRIALTVVNAFNWSRAVDN